MSYVRCLRGLVSSIAYSADAPINLDAADGRPVEMVLDLARLAHIMRRPKFAAKPSRSRLSPVLW